MRRFPPTTCATLLGATMVFSTVARGDLALNVPTGFQFVARGDPPFSSATGHDADWLSSGGVSDHMVSYSWFARLPSDGKNRPLGSLATPTIVSTPAWATLTYDMSSGAGDDADRFTVTQRLETGFGPLIDSISVRNNSTSARTINLIRFVNVDAGADGAAAPDLLEYINLNGCNILSNLDLGFSLAADSNVAFQAGDASALLARISLTNLNLNFSRPPDPLGDIGVAFQWRMALQPGETQSAFALTTFFFPEPATGAVMAIGAGMQFFIRQHRQRHSSRRSGTRVRSL